MKTALVLLLAICHSSARAEVPFDLKAYPTLVNVKTVVPDIEVDLKYATNNNFVHTNLYGDFKECYLQKDAAVKLANADKLLKKLDSKLRLHAYDCARPKSVQLKMWSVVKGTNGEKYVANPYSKTGSIHNYGCAVDIGLSRAGSGIVDMGSPFDFFGEAAHPDSEIAQTGDGRLTAKQLESRLQLRYAMVASGFIPISREWWHFNCELDDVARTKYKMIE